MPPALCCSQEPKEQLPEGPLHFCDSILEITTAVALKQCQHAVEASTVCCLALLMKEGQHYFSTLRPLSKSQTTSMHKQVGERLGTSPRRRCYAALTKVPACSRQHMRLHDETLMLASQVARMYELLHTRT